MRQLTAQRAIVAVCVSIVAVYLIVGSHYGNYYDSLSRAFLEGKVSLQDEHRDHVKALLELPDPYDPDANEVVRAQLHDLTFYQGRFYLAWGPAPALILAASRLFHRTPIADGELVTVFLTGLLIFNTLFFLWSKKRFYPKLPSWYVAIAVLLAGLHQPILWLLGRAAVYETAIAGGQCFLVAGIYFGLTGVEGDRPAVWRLFLSGLSLALAFGSRVSLIVAVIFVATSLTVWIWKHRRSLDVAKVRIATVVLWVPLISGILAGGIYNYSRFGSFFEFGIRYQLTGMNSNRLFANGKATSLAYMPHNLFCYLALPFSVSDVKPYIVPQLGNSQRIQNLEIPHFTREHITGILWSTPIVWLSLVPLLVVISRICKRAIHSRRDPDGERIATGLSLQEATELTVTGTAICALLPLLAFIGMAMRYVADFSTSLVLLTVFGIWEGAQRASANEKWRHAVIGVTIALVVISIVLGIHMGIQSSDLQSMLYK